MIKGNRKDALSVLKKIKAAESHTEPALLIACIYSGLGYESEMFRWLQIALEKKSTPIYIVALSCNFRRYHEHPRFNDFLRSIGLPPMAQTTDLAV